MSETGQTKTKDDPVMSQLWGFALTGLSILVAAIVSGLRLKPYLDAGVEYTPATFALYPAAIAVTITVPVVFLLRWWTGKKEIAVGPVTLIHNQPFIVLGCLLYILVAVTFFPYQTLSPEPPHSGTVQHAIWHGEAGSAAQ
jgi:hypothetical protein